MKTALVTGATSGIGQEFCWQISNGGNNLVMVARNVERLEALAEKIRRVNGVNVEILPADLGQPEDLAAVCRRLSWDGHPEAEPETTRGIRSRLSRRAARSKIDLQPVDMLVNNAGFGSAKSFLDEEFSTDLHALDVMVRAVMATCYYAGRQMRDAGQGQIINISSVAADTGMGPYSAHKAWVRAFSEGLHEELKGSGVSVTAVMPGLTRTEFHSRTGAASHEGASNLMWMSADQVVKESLAAADRGQALVTPSLRYKMVYHTARVAPRSLVRAVMSKLPHT